jgi:3-oxoacyl-[acyl-carrier protein] reductase
VNALAGKRALVTGGSRGIGAAIAAMLAEHGADVAITYERSEQLAREVVGDIEAAGRTGVAIRADFYDLAAVRQSVNEAARLLGGLDILVNNAGIVRYSSIEDVAVEDIEALFRVNVHAPIVASSAAMAHLGPGGRIITIGSAGAERTVGEGGTVYAMTKGSLQAFTRGLARELGPRDVTVNLVQPGSTDTDMNPDDGEFAEYQRGLIPLGRFGTAQDVAAAVVFLASPAARQVSGVVLNADGGLNT